MKEKDSVKVNWGLETLRVLGIVTKVGIRILSYVMNILMTVLLIGLITGIIVGTVFAIYINNYLDLEIDPNITVVANRDSATRLYYVDFETEEDRINRIGTEVEIEDQRLTGDANTIAVKYSQLPKNLVNAFVAIEDQQFNNHNGVNWYTTVNAFINFVLPTGKSAGGSTITQQLIKNITGEDEVTIQRKVEEIFRAINFEKQYSKEQILEMYMNIINLGNGQRGVQAAAQYYFGKDVSQLTLVECAAFAAIVKNPSQYEPIRHNDDRIVITKAGEEKTIYGNASRRWIVLETMKNEGMITEAECRAAQEAELNLVSHNDDEENDAVEEGMTIFSWYTEAVITEFQKMLMEKYGVDKSLASKMIYNNGYKIVTAMDPEIQAIVEEVYRNDSDYFPSTGKGLQPQSAMVICHPATGDVVALVGGRGEKIINRGTERAATTVRPPGSSIKPLSVYAPALDAGLITYGSVVDDTPILFNERTLEQATASTEAVISYTPYPSNLPVVYKGLTTIHSAVTRSVNTVAMKVLQMLTVDKSFSFMKDKLHFDSLIDSVTTSTGQIHTDRGLASLSLGQPTYGVTLLEMTAAYCIFANEGMYNEPNLILYVKDADGNLIFDFRDDPEVVISVESASIMTKMMEKVMNEGTGMGCTLRHTIDVAGKTGTTSSDFDRYFVGYTPYYVAGVWTGYDMPQSLNSFGENPSLQVWDIVMTKVHQKYIDDANNGVALKSFETPPGVIQATYCRDSGKLMTDACLLDPRGNRAEVGYFTRETVPTDHCETHVKVRRDNSTGLIACPDCNPADCSYVGLVRVETRSFPIQLYVEDAQYVYREMPETVKPAGWWGDPFFINMLGEKEYCGTSYAETPYNAYCYKHCDYRPWGGNPPAEDSGYYSGDKPSYDIPESETDETDSSDETVDRDDGNADDSYDPGGTETFGFDEYEDNEDYGWFFGFH